MSLSDILHSTLKTFVQSLEEKYEIKIGDEMWGRNSRKSSSVPEGTIRVSSDPQNPIVYHPRFGNFRPEIARIARVIQPQVPRAQAVQAVPQAPRAVPQAPRTVRVNLVSQSQFKLEMERLKLRSQHTQPKKKSFTLPSDLIRYIVSFIIKTSKTISLHRRVCKHWNESLQLSAFENDFGTECVSYFSSNEEADTVALRTLGLRTRYFDCKTNERVIELSENLPNLKSIWISQSSHLQTFTFSPFSHSHSLKNLTLFMCNRITTESVEKLIEMSPNLESLLINDCPLVATFQNTKIFENLTRLTLIDLPLFQINPEMVLSKCTYLSLLGMNLTDDICRFIVSLTSIKTLKLQNRNLTDLTLIEISKNCKEIENLCISKNRFTDIGVLEISKSCCKILTLELEELNLTDEAVFQVVKNLPLLKYINIYHSTKTISNRNFKLLRIIKPELKMKYKYLY